MREKKTNDNKEADGAVTFEVIEVKQQAKKRITGQKKFQGQKNTYSRYTNQNWMNKNKGNRQTGKRKKMIEGQRLMQNEMYRKEMKAKAKAHKGLSFRVLSHWPLVDEIHNLTLSSLLKFTPGTPEIFLRAGKVAEFKHGIDSVFTKNKIKFTSFPAIDDVKLSTNDINVDENIFNYIEEQKIEGLKIIASDMVLATLMNVKGAFYSWDIVVEKFGDMIFLSKRGEESRGKDEVFQPVDIETAGESSITPPPADTDNPKLGKRL